MIKKLGKWLLLAVAGAGSLSAGTVDKKVYEAQEFFSKERDFIVVDDIYAGKGAFIGINPDRDFAQKETVAMEIPWPEGTYEVWVRARDISLKLRGSKDMRNRVKTSTKGKWEWLYGGRHGSRQVGAILEVYVSNAHSKQAGIDSVLLTGDKNFRPDGVYNEYTRDNTVKTSPEKNTVQQNSSIQVVKITVDPKRKIQNISPYLATACVTRPKRHMIDDNPGWDKMMHTFFNGNMLILLIHAYRKPDANGNYWDFAALDKYVAKAIDVWGCKELMFLPQWWLEKPRRQNKPPTQEDLDAGEEVFMQLVRRYGKKGRLNVKYWAVCDEWTLSRYWRKNMDKFVNYYTRLVRKAKGFNPELKLGGPVNAWPVQSCIVKLLETCPELDFIAWNMYITGSANTPLEKLYQRTENCMGSRVEASREASKQVLKKELPVIVTAYGPNYRAWEPPDLKLAGPSNGAWQALAMSKLAEGGCFAAGSYNIQARDCGLFGPRDRHAMKGGFIPRDIDEQTIYVRPSARVMRFFQQYITGKSQCLAENSLATEVNCLAVNSGDNDIALVVSNFSPTPKQVEIRIKGYKLTVSKEFDLPTQYLYCDQNKVLEGNGFIFSKSGTANIYMPPFSAQLFFVKQ